MKGFGLVTFEGEVGGEAVGHLAVGFGGGEGFVDDEGGGFFALAELDVAEGDGGKDDAERGVVADDVFEGFNGLGKVAGSHLLVAERDSKQRLTRLKREALFDLVGGQLHLILVLIHTGAMVVDHGRVRRVHAQRGIELLECLVVHAIDAQRLARDKPDIPIIACGLEKVFDAVAGGLLFAPREEHVDAVEIGFD